MTKYQLSFTEDEEAREALIASLQLSSEAWPQTDDQHLTSTEFASDNLEYRKILVTEVDRPGPNTVKPDDSVIMFKTMQRRQFLVFNTEEMRKLRGFEIRRIVCDTSNRTHFHEINRRCNGHPHTATHINQDFFGATDNIFFTFRMPNTHKTQFNFHFLVFGKPTNRNQVKFLTDPQVGNDPDI